MRCSSLSFTADTDFVRWALTPAAKVPVNRVRMERMAAPRRTGETPRINCLSVLFIKSIPNLFDLEGKPQKITMSAADV
jgi:hypothetical protein